MANDNSNKRGYLKAYNNYEFLNSPAARIIRILAEMVEPENRFRKNWLWNTVVFFGSARTLPGRTARRNMREIEQRINNSRRKTPRLNQMLEIARRDVTMSRYYDDAVKLSEKLTEWFITLEPHRKNFKICTGGGPGIMEAANKGARKAGGQSVGLNISLPFEQVPNRYQTKELSFEFHYFFIRKFWFFYLAKGLIVFPGGFGTLDEFFELMTLIQTHKTRKRMPVVLYGSEYWKEVINLEKMAEWGTISNEDLNLFEIFDDVDLAFDYLKKKLTDYHLKDIKNKIR